MVQRDHGVALRAGLEVQPLAATPLTLRAGYVHETGASTTSYISVLTVDTSKHILTVGAGFKIGRVRLDAMFGHVFMADERVARGQSCVPQVNPIKDGAPEPACTLWYNPAGLAELLDDGRRWQLLVDAGLALHDVCLLYTSPSPRD